jgi:hypothetical protein
LAISKRHVTLRRRAEAGDVDLDERVVSAARDGSNEGSAAKLRVDDDRERVVRLGEVDTSRPATRAIDLGEASTSVLVPKTPKTAIVGVRDEIESEAAKLLLAVEDEARQTAASLGREGHAMAGSLDVKLSAPPTNAARRGRSVLEGGGRGPLRGERDRPLRGGFGRVEPVAVFAVRDAIRRGPGDRVVVVHQHQVEPSFAQSGLERRALRLQCGEALGEQERAGDAPGALLQLGTRRVKTHPVRVRVHRQDRQLVPVVADELEVVVHPREHRPGPRRTVTFLVVALEELAKSLDRIVEVHTDRAEHVRRSREGFELANEAVDASRDVPAGPPGDRRNHPVPSNDAGVRQHVSLEIREGVPVAQHLGAVVVAPDEVEGLEFLLQHLRGRPLQREGALSPVVGGDEVHTVDPGHRDRVDSHRPHERRKMRGVTKVVWKIGGARNAREPLSAQPLLAQMEVAEDRFGMRKERIGGSERRREDAKLAPLEERAQSCLLFGMPLPENLQEEDALDAIDPQRILLERREDAREDGLQSRVEVLIRRLQPVGVPMTALGEHEDMPGILRNAEPSP